MGVSNLIDDFFFQQGRSFQLVVGEKSAISEAREEFDVLVLALKIRRAM